MSFNLVVVIVCLLRYLQCIEVHVCRCLSVTSCGNRQDGVTETRDFAAGEDKEVALKAAEQWVANEEA